MASGGTWRFERLALEDGLLNALFAEEQPQVVVNLAAQAGVRYPGRICGLHPSNLVGSHVLEGCRHYGVENLVYASSSSLTAVTVIAVKSNSRSITRDFYAASKKANELMAHTYSHLYGLPAIICVFRFMAPGATRYGRCSLHVPSWRVNR